MNDVSDVCQPCLDSDAQDSRGFKTPYTPSREEVEEHERTHLPFRDWCKHCVLGRAKGDAHFRDQVDSSKPRISWDYMYMHEKGCEKKRPDVVEGEGLPIVVMKISRPPGGCGGVIAFAVPSRGDCEYAITKGAQVVN